MATNKMAQDLVSATSRVDTSLRAKLKSSRERALRSQIRETPSAKIAGRLRRRFNLPEPIQKITPTTTTATTETPATTQRYTPRPTPAPQTLEQQILAVKEQGLTGAEAGYHVSKIVGASYAAQYKTIRDENLKTYRGQGEERRAADQAAKAELETAALASLTPATKDWYTEQAAAYTSLMTELDAKYKTELEKIKEKWGKDPIQYTNRRLKLEAQIYPDWTHESQRAEANIKERADKRKKILSAAKEAGVTGLSDDEIYALGTSTKLTAKNWGTELGLSLEQIAKIKGMKVEDLPKPKEKGPEITEITIPATQAEIAQTQASEASGETCTATIETVKVTLRDGNIILVDAVDDPAKDIHCEDNARAKAEAAGYDVAWATKKLSTQKVYAKPEKEPEFAPAEIKKYEFTLSNGKTRTFEAVTLEEAEANVKKWGADVATLNEIATRQLSDYEIGQALRGLASRSPMDYARGLEKYGQVEKGSVPVRTSEGIVFFSQETVDHLETLPVYDETTGSKENKLVNAYSAWIDALVKAKDFILTEIINPPLFATAGAAEGEVEGIRLIRATDEEVAEAEASEAEANERGWSCYTTIATFKAKLTDGSVVYVEALDSPYVEGKASVREKLAAAGFGGAIVTKADVPEGGWETVNTIDVPSLVQEIGESEARETLRNIGVTNSTELVNNVKVLDDIAESVGGYKEMNPETGEVSTNYTQLQADIEKANTDIENYVAGKDEEGNNKYDLTAAVDGGMKRDELKLAGFEEQDIDRAEDTVRTAEATGVALPGKIEWENVITGKTLSDKDYKALIAEFEAKRDKLAVEGKMYGEEWEAMGEHPENIHHLTVPSGKRVLITAASTVFFSPARVLLPEVKVQDIGKLEWAIGGAQLATWAMPFIPGKGVAGKVISTGASAAAGSIFGYGLSQTWSKLPTHWKVIGVIGTLAVSAPAIYRLGGLAYRAGRAAFGVGRKVAQGTYRLARQIHAGETGQAHVKPEIVRGKTFRTERVITPEEAGLSPAEGRNFIQVRAANPKWSISPKDFKFLERMGQQLKRAIEKMPKRADTAPLSRPQVSPYTSVDPMWRYLLAKQGLPYTKANIDALIKAASQHSVSPSSARAFYQGTVPSYAEIIAAGLPKGSTWKPMLTIWKPGASDIPVPITYNQALSLIALGKAGWKTLFGKIVPKAFPAGIAAGSALGVVSQAATVAAAVKYNEAIQEGKTEAEAIQQAETAAKTVIQSGAEAIAETKGITAGLTKTQLEYLNKLHLHPEVKTNLQFAFQSLQETKTRLKEEERVQTEQLQRQQLKTAVRFPYETPYYTRTPPKEGGTDRTWWRRNGDAQEQKIPGVGANIVVKAKFNGRDWEGGVHYALVGKKNKIIGTRVKATHHDVAPDQYTLKYIGGAPIGTIDMHISPSRTKSVGAGEQITYTIEFSTKPIFVKAKETRPGLQVSLPTAKGLGGVIDTDVEDVHTVVGVKQVAPISATEEVTVGVRKLTPGDYVEKHGSHSTYVLEPTQAIEMEEVPMADLLSEKPAKIDERLWKELARNKQSITMLGEPQETLLPFGVKEARPVEKRIKLAEPVYGSGVAVTKKMGSQMKRKLLGWNSRYYLGHELPTGSVGGTL